MDGTLIDLHFDSVLWNQHLPNAFAAHHNLAASEAEKQLFDYMEQQTGRIDYYCIDRWAEFTGLDIMALHRAGKDRLAYREGSEEFLIWLQKQPQQTILTTNAHRKSLALKDAELDLLQYFDADVSSHDYRQVKECAEFWQIMQDAVGFDPKRTLFVDDHEGVLNAAREHGIEHLYCVSQPDSQREPRSASQFPLVRELASLIGEQI